MDIDNRCQPVLKTVMILDLLKDKLGSDYKTAKALGVPSNYVSTWRSKGLILSDSHGLKAAEILDFPQDAMLLSLAAERAMNTENAKIIRRLAEQHYPPDYPEKDDEEKTPGHGRQKGGTGTDRIPVRKVP